MKLTNHQCIHIWWGQLIPYIPRYVHWSHTSYAPLQNLWIQWPHNQRSRIMQPNLPCVGAYCAKKHYGVIDRSSVCRKSLAHCNRALFSVHYGDPALLLGLYKTSDRRGIHLSYSCRFNYSMVQEPFKESHYGLTFDPHPS